MIWLIPCFAYSVCTQDSCRHKLSCCLFSLILLNLQTFCLFLTCLLSVLLLRTALNLPYFTSIALFLLLSSSLADKAAFVRQPVFCTTAAVQVDAGQRWSTTQPLTSSLCSSSFSLFIIIFYTSFSPHLLLMRSRAETWPPLLPLLVANGVDAA